jgi:hypothetical protein
MRPSFHPKTGKSHWHRNPFRDKDGKVRSRRICAIAAFSGKVRYLTTKRSLRQRGGNLQTCGSKLEQRHVPQQPRSVRYSILV